MDKPFSLKGLFIKILVLIPLFYIGFGWYVGLNYGRKGAILGPFDNIPVVMKTQLLGSSLEDISGSNALVMVVPPGGSGKPDQGSSYFKITGYFEIPGTWNFDFVPSDSNSTFKKTFALTGSYSRAIVHELKNSRRSLGSLSLRELNDFLKVAGRNKDIEKLKPYLFLSRFEEKYPWAYSDTVLLSKAMGNIFKDSMLPYDILGLVGMVVLFIALAIRNFGLWMYYLYWVLAYWFGRIGYHDINLAFVNDGWQVILWSFLNGFIQKEGRLFLIIAVVLSIICFTILGILYLVKHVIPRKKRELEDFFKIDKEARKRKELSIETVEFKKVHYDINKKLNQYAKTDKYFLAVSDDKQDVVVDETTLNRHLHVLGPSCNASSELRGSTKPALRSFDESIRDCGTSPGQPPAVVP